MRPHKQHLPGCVWCSTRYKKGTTSNQTLRLIEQAVCFVTWLVDIKCLLYLWKLEQCQLQGFIFHSLTPTPSPTHPYVATRSSPSLRLDIQTEWCPHILAPWADSWPGQSGLSGPRLGEKEVGGHSPAGACPFSSELAVLQGDEFCSTLLKLEAQPSWESYRFPAVPMMGWTCLPHSQGQDQTPRAHGPQSSGLHLL